MLDEIKNVKKLTHHMSSLKIKKSHIKNRRLSSLVMCYAVESVGRVPKCRVRLAACQNVELAERVPKCRISSPRVKMSSQLAACQNVESAGRGL